MKHFNLWAISAAPVFHAKWYNILQRYEEQTTLGITATIAFGETSPGNIDQQGTDDVLFISVYHKTHSYEFLPAPRSPCSSIATASLQGS